MFTGSSVGTSVIEQGHDLTATEEVQDILEHVDRPRFLRVITPCTWPLSDCDGGWCAASQGRITTLLPTTVGERSG
ncbi:hypothetical protein BaRGS_00013515 [Batillaria attramentaria]|uniref:Uncharacterized protein n=1 Tax=Batillaria attramentaria TaxID=370345 RepID=A0ABD0L7S5_9CAEN